MASEMTTTENLAEKVDALTAENKTLKTQVKSLLVERKPYTPAPIVQDLHRVALEAEYKEALLLIQHMFAHQSEAFFAFAQMSPELQEMFRVVTGFDPNKV